jgi:hypothetical protein
LRIYEVAKTTVCNNCDTSIKLVPKHFFHYDAKLATGALANRRKGLRAAKNGDNINFCHGTL